MLVAYEARLATGALPRDACAGEDARARGGACGPSATSGYTQNVSDQFDDTGFASKARVKGDRLSRALFPFASDPLKARNQLRRAVLDPSRRAGTAIALGGNLICEPGRAGRVGCRSGCMAARRALGHGRRRRRWAVPTRSWQAKARAFQEGGWIGRHCSRGRSGRPAATSAWSLAQVLRRVAIRLRLGVAAAGRASDRAGCRRVYLRPCPARRRLRRRPLPARWMHGWGGVATGRASRSGPHGAGPSAPSPRPSARRPAGRRRPPKLRRQKQGGDDHPRG
jgi:hypothetical protein